MVHPNSPQPDEYPVPPQEPSKEPSQVLHGIKPFVNPQTSVSKQAEHINNTSTEQHTTPTTPPPVSNVHPNRSETEKKRKAREKLKKIRQHKHYGTVRFAILSFVVFLIIFNFQVIYSQILFLITPKTASTTTQTQTSTPVVQNTSSTPAPAEVVGPEDVLIIPKIGVRAPLIFINTLSEPEMLKALQNGVVHYAGTAYPGENGNAVFFGHSSNDWWEPGNFKFVFVLLERLVPGDTYEIHYQSHKYVYRVTNTKVVAPTDLSVLTQTNTPTSTLITCTPPGTSWRRFVVSADQIEPAPTTPSSQQAATSPQTTTTNATAVAATQSGTLPSASPSILSQIQSTIAGFFSRFFGGSSSNNSDTTPAQQNTTQPNHLPEVS